MSLHVHCTAFYSPATEALINNNNNNNNSCRGHLENFPAGYFVLVLWVIMHCIGKIKT